MIAFTIIMIILTLGNIASAIYNYKKENFKTVLFNLFVSGFCLFGIFDILIKNI